LNAWLQCQRSYGYKYVARIPGKWNWQLAGGLAYGDTLNQFHIAQIEGTTEFTNRNNLTQYLDATLDALSDTHQLPRNVDYTDARVDGGKLVQLYATSIGARMKPLAVELEVNPVIGGIEHLGFETSARDSLQLINYDIALDDPSHTVRLIHGVRYKRGPQLMVREHVVTPADRARLTKVTTIMDSLITQQVWLPADPSSWKCSEKFCDYWNICRGREGGWLPLPGEPGYVEPEPKV
jgi:hypothetical protein